MKLSPYIFFFVFLLLIAIMLTVIKQHSFLIQTHKERIETLEKFQYLLEDYLYIEQYSTKIPTTKNEEYRTKNK